MHLLSEYTPGAVASCRTIAVSSSVRSVIERQLQGLSVSEAKQVLARLENPQWDTWYRFKDVVSTGAAYTLSAITLGAVAAYATVTQPTEVLSDVASVSLRGARRLLGTNFCPGTWIVDSGNVTSTGVTLTPAYFHTGLPWIGAATAETYLPEPPTEFTISAPLASNPVTRSGDGFLIFGIVPLKQQNGSVYIPDYVNVAAGPQWNRTDQLSFWSSCRGNVTEAVRPLLSTTTLSFKSGVVEMDGVPVAACDLPNNATKVFVHVESSHGTGSIDIAIDQLPSPCAAPASPSRTVGLSDSVVAGIVVGSVVGTAGLVVAARKVIQRCRYGTPVDVVVADIRQLNPVQQSQLRRRLLSDIQPDPVVSPTSEAEPRRRLASLEMVGLRAAPAPSYTRVNTMDSDD